MSFFVPHTKTIITLLSSARRRHHLRWAAAVSLLMLFLAGGYFLATNTPAAQAANPDGSLRIEVNTAYNLVVDSNAESPSTYAPEAFYIGANICNDGATDLTDVVAYSGNFDEIGTNHTAGIYPARTHPTLVGTFSLTHEGGAADATRNMGTIPAGECKMQYWLASYPSLDDAGTAVHRPSIKPDDDLWLQYDIWAVATEGVTPRTANQTTTVSLRNEISAMANKIWPNGDNKVPLAYKTAIDDLLGWDSATGSGSNTAYPGELLSTQGIWYDLGNVGKGFDNNGDFIPDQNAWMQPVGDPALFNPSCFRLVHTYGIIIVKLKGGGELLIPFEDQLYFEGIPPNTGTVGLVYYEFLTLNGACTSSMTPYQEVASGADNEKFNGDYGHFVPPLASYAPAVSFDKSVDKAQIGPTFPETLSYTLAFTNTGPVDAGNIAFNMPLTLVDSIPAGTTYVAGSAAHSIAGGSISATIYYSTDAGSSWVNTEPGDPTTVTDIQWWLGAPLAPTQAGTVSFQVSVPASYSNVAVPNTGGISFGGATPFAEDTTYTLLRGTNSIGDLVWKDENNDGTDNGGTESGIDGVGLTLYWDQNGNGTLDATDIFMSTQDTVNGAYSFTDLPDGNFLVAVNSSDPQIPAGYKATTAELVAVTGLSGAFTDADFGFGPPLSINKTVLTTPIYEGQEVVYHIDVTNNRPSSTGAACTINLWAGASASQTSGGWIIPSNAINSAGPDSVYATSNFQTGSETLGGTSFGGGTQPGNIVSVEALFSLYVDGALVNDIVNTELYFNNSSTAISTAQYTNVEINPFGTTSSAQGLLSWDVSSARSWAWADFAGSLELVLITDKVNADDNVIMYLDAIGFKVTTDEICPGDLGNIMSTVPLTDTYDASLLQFVSADPAVASVSSTTSPYANTGLLNWNNVGPIDGQATKTITVTFAALEPAGNVATPITNTANISNAYFLDGTPANDSSDDALGTIIPTGSIAGTLWSEGAAGTAGWVNATTGYEAGTDSFIPGTTVNLYGCTNGSGVPLDPTTVQTNKACSANSGTWELLDTQITDNNGDYLFESLLNGFYYVSVDSTTIPGTVSQTAEAGTGASNQNGTGRTCGTCDHIWGNSTANLINTAFNPINSASEDITNINFGYDVPPAISGKVWQDFDGDGNQDAGDIGIASVTVTLTGSDLSSVTVTVDADGNYEFTNLTAGVTYTIIVNTGTLPGTDPWTQTAESDNGINNAIVLTPTAGQILTGNDFGFNQTGSSTIGDTLFYDWNGDGSQGAGDEGIKNVTMNLYADTNSNGVYDAAVDALVSATTTTVTGFYEFTGLPAGDYIVVVDTNDNDFPASVNMTADPDESNVCSTCDSQAAVTNLASATSVDTIDFGYQPFGPASIGDTVFYDANGNATQSGGTEVGLSGVIVELYSDANGDGTYTLAMTTTTNTNGNYSFTGLPDGSYQVKVASDDTTINNSNYVASTASSFTAVVSGGDVTSLNGVGCSNCNLNADFGFMPLGSIGDLIFWDDNGNGEPDFGDRGISGVTVTLTNSSVITDSEGMVWAIGTYITTTTTSDGSDGNPVGSYLFASLVPGDYDVSVDPTAAPISNAAQTADPDRDGVACDDNTYPSMPACDDATTVTILPGTNFMGADLGYQPAGVVGDFVWFDQNGDGIQDQAEIGIPGLVVTITNGVDTFTTTTDYNGEYSFSQLADDSWTLTIEQPASMTPTTGAESIGSLSTTVVLSGGVVTSIGGSGCSNCDLNVDLGFQMNGPYGLNGTICLEDTATTSNVGGCDIGDTDVMTHTIYLYNDAGAYLGATTTNATGVYTFTNLIDDTYYVSVNSAGAPLDNTALTTTAVNTPANSSNPSSPVSAITNSSTTSNYQTVVVNATTAGGDNLVIDVDFAYESTVDYDFGDLPNSYNSTELGDDGPRHILDVTPTLYLGTAPDSEADGTASAAASSDSDDGVSTTLPLWTEGTDGGSVTVDVTGGGYLVGWFDFNGDGDFLDSGEMVISQAVTSGAGQVISFDVPAGLCSGDCATANLSLYSRFRLFAEEPVLDRFAYSGAVSNGEVEDYLFTAAPTAITLNGARTLGQFNGGLVIIVVFGLSLIIIGSSIWRKRKVLLPAKR